LPEKNPGTSRKYVGILTPHWSFSLYLNKISLSQSIAFITPVNEQQNELKSQIGDSYQAFAFSSWSWRRKRWNKLDFSFDKEITAMYLNHTFDLNFKKWLISFVEVFQVDWELRSSCSDGSGHSPSQSLREMKISVKKKLLTKFSKKYIFLYSSIFLLDLFPKKRVRSDESAGSVCQRIWQSWTKQALWETLMNS